MAGRWAGGLHVGTPRDELAYGTPEDGGQTLVTTRGLAVETRADELIPEVLVTCKERVIQRVPRVLAQLGEEHELSPGVAFPERVNHVELTPDLSQLHDNRRVSSAG